MREPYRLRLQFFGVRGSRPTPVAANLGFGGNTTCLEVRSAADDLVLIDAGSGLSNVNCDAHASRLHFLMTHFHIDHIQGLPFFAPLFESAAQMTFWSHEPPTMVGPTLDVLMSSPYSPALDSVAATREYHQTDGSAFALGAITIHPFPLNHPQGALGYRIESGGATIVHASDLEHGHAELDTVLRDYAQDADVLIYDAQYTDEEYGSKRGWGHSTWREATRVARDAGVKQLMLFHHDPRHDDRTMQAIATEARRHFENTDAAREGVLLTL